MIEDKSKTWIVIDHPQQLALAICISRNCFSHYGLKSNLIISRHAYWEGLSFDEYKKEFKKVSWFERLDYPPPWLSLRLQFAASLIMIPKMFRMKSFVKNLGIGTNDVIVGLSTQQFLENMVLSNYKKTKKIGIVASYVYGNSKKRVPRSKYRHSLGTLLVKYLQLLFGMNQVVCKYRRRKGKKLDGDTRQKYKKPLNEIYDYLIVMKNFIVGPSVYKGRFHKNIIFSTYPYSYKLGNVKPLVKKRVIFLGEDFLSANNLDYEKHISLANKCLNFVKRFYGDSYDLLYKPHPRWNKELEVLDLKGYNIYKDSDPAEIFFIKNRINIHSVFSVISTASRSAINAGLPSYLFYKIFPFRKSIMKEWERLVGEMPENSVIKNLKTKPGKIDLHNWRNNETVFLKDFNLVFNSVMSE